MAVKKSKNNIVIPNGYKSTDTNRRLKWLKEQTGVEIDGNLENKPEDLKGIIENHIGFMKVPMAIAGPLLVNGNYAKGEFFVPICTLEGTLIIMWRIWNGSGYKVLISFLFHHCTIIKFRKMWTD